MAARRDEHRQRMFALVREQLANGETCKAFCKRREMSVWSFYEWRRRYREAQLPSNGEPAHLAEPPSFIPLLPQPASSSIAYAYSFDDGSRFEISRMVPVEEVLQLVRGLRESRCSA